VTNGFDSAAAVERDLLVGEIRVARTFTLFRDGSLWPSHMKRTAWVDGVNEASCPTGRHLAPAAGCKCGFWGYGSPASLAEQIDTMQVVAVVACWGRVVPGTVGIRAQYARIEGLWLAGIVKYETRERVRDRYPSAVIYRTREALFRQHPLTVLPCYSKDLGFELRSRLRKRRVQRAGTALILSALIVCGLLPATVHQNRPAVEYVQLAIVAAGIALFASGIIGAIRAPGRYAGLGRAVLGHAMPVSVVLWAAASLLSGSTAWLLRVPFIPLIVAAGVVEFIPPRDSRPASREPNQS
jgi:hypothetical protein